MGRNTAKLENLIVILPPISAKIYAQTLKMSGCWKTSMSFKEFWGFAP